MSATEIILVRHAHAEWPGYEGRDFDRPLTPRGEKDALAAGGAMRAAGLSPVLALVSPARRTRQTAEIIAGALQLPISAIRCIDGLYNATGQALEHELRRVAAEHAGPIMLVAHNPGISELARYLSGDSEARPLCPADWRVLQLAWSVRS